jgi:Kdo2-lipid IVA lauroyltransferase/acyltransferase
MTSPSSPSAVTPRSSSAPSWMKRLRHILEAVAFFSAIGFFRLFSVDRASAVGGWIGRNMLVRTPMSRRAISNLSSAFPEKTSAEIQAIRRMMWDNLGRVMAEYAHLDEIHLTGPDPRIQGSGAEHFEAARARGKGVILVSGHFANWEIMPFAARDYGLTGGVVVRPANNPYVSRWLEKVRSRNGMTEQIPKGTDAMWRIFRLLRSGEVVLMLVDQRASEGVLVPFFGRDAFTTLAPAALALRLGSAVIPVSNERLGGARFRMTVHPAIEPPCTGDANRDLTEFTATMTQFIEAQVRERPHEWLWIHRRWVRKDARQGNRTSNLQSAMPSTRSSK